MQTSAFRVLLILAMVAGAWARAADVEREMVLTPLGGESDEDREIARRQRRVAEAGAGAGAAEFEGLAWAYVAKARRTLDGGFYKLAEKTVAVSERELGATVESRLIRGHVAHNLHRFRVAEEIARALVAERGAAADWALLSDALLEQGKAAEAIGALQRLEERRPGPASWSRIGQVRWIKGDVAGAMDATLAALRATEPADRTTRAWLLARLANFELQCGAAERALRWAAEANATAEAYPPGLFVEGKAWAALGKADAARDALRRMMQLQPTVEGAWWWADFLRAAGDVEEAARWERWIEERGTVEDPRTTAWWLATRGASGAERAVRLARAELRERADVFSRDALAWALLAAGEVGDAVAEGGAALAEGTKDARLFLHAGEIARARGEEAEAKAFFAQAKEREGALTPSERARLERANFP